jgi:hypothetical protein
MAPDRKARWKKEVGWLLSVADHIVEFVAKRQILDNGTEMEVERSPHAVARIWRASFSSAVLTESGSARRR